MPQSKDSVPAVIKGRAKLAPIYVPSHGYNSEEHSQLRFPPLSRVLWVLRRHVWQFMLFIAGCAMVTFIVSKLLTPIYESTATIDVDRQMPRVIPGQSSVRQPRDDMNQYLATQIRLIQSDSVLRSVALKFKLDNERQNISVPKGPPVNRTEAPVFLKDLKVTRVPGTYLLQISYRSANPHLAADVANAVAASYIEHTYDMRIRSSTGFSSFAEKQLSALKANTEKSSLALAQFEAESNGVNPERETDTLSVRLKQLNAEYTKAKAARVAKETQMKALDRNRKSVSKRVQREYTRAANRERLLGREIGDIKAKIDNINKRLIEYKSLERRVEADKKAYGELAQKVKEAGVNAGFQEETIRLADPARPGLTPALPNIRLNVLLACLLAGVLAIAVAGVSAVFDRTVRDPDHAHRIFNADVIGILPMACPRWKSFSLSKLRPSPVIRWQDSNDKSLAGYVEAIRLLRNSIVMNNTDHRLRSVIITSAGPMEGRSTTAVHLARAYAEQRRKTLLIDCDLRKPSIHKYFDVSNSVGMTNVITEGMPWRDAVARVDETPELHLLLSGPFTRKAPELVGGEIASIIAESVKMYDFVIIDAPPMLGFAEPLQIATHVGGVVIVTVAGQTDSRAALSLMNTFNRLRIPVAGIVLNKVLASTSGAYDHYRRYGNNRYAKQG